MAKLSAQEIWGEITKSFNVSVDVTPRMRAWIASTHAVSFANNLLLLKVHDTSVRSGLERRDVSSQLALACSAAGYPAVDFAYVVDGVVPLFEPKAIFDPNNDLKISNAALSETDYTKAAKDYWVNNPCVRAEFTFNEFLELEANSTALSYRNIVIRDPGAQLQALYIYGPPGVGKTHFAQSIGWDFVDREKPLSVVYATPSSFMNEYQEVGRSKSVTLERRFVRKYSSCDCLIIDDIQTFEPTWKKSLGRLFQFLDERKLAGKQVIVVSDCDFKKLDSGVFSQRIKDRFGIPVSIGFPKKHEIAAYVRRLSSERQVDLPADVFSLICSAEGQTMRVIRKLADMVFMEHGFLGSVSLKSARQMFSDVIVQNSAKLTLEDIVDVVCRYYSLDVADLQGGGKGGVITKARRQISYQAGLSLPAVTNGQIAEFLNLDTSAISKNQSAVAKTNKTSEGLLESNTLSQNINDFMKKGKRL